MPSARRAVIGPESHRARSRGAQGARPVPGRSAYIPGGFDEQTGEVFLFEREPHGRFQGPELADGFVRAALAQDADVFELPAEKIPGDSGIAALYRY